MKSSIDIIKNQYEKNQEKILQDFFSFLKIPSISSEEHYTESVLTCADWVQSFLTKIGFKVEYWPTKGHPVLFATYLEAGPDKPTLLIYNHYDVQPVDPLEEWISQPFEPNIRNGEVFARGAQDNKGQCFYVLQALKHLMQETGSLPVNIKLCIEGEEETGSAGIAEILNQKKDKLKADYLAIVDVGIHSMDKPSVTLGVRGMATFDLEVKGTNVDLHSGTHGGVVYNPIHALVEILASLRDSDGKITVPGFYDDVAQMSEEEKKALSFEFDEATYLKQFGSKPTGGEKNYSHLERAWLRPTLEINGICGGYHGSGFKTVIPAKAHAKLSCRLVPNQKPEVIQELVKKHIESLAPPGISVHLTARPGTGEAVRANPSSPIVQAFAESYQDIFGKPCGYIFEGGSIPIVTELAKASESEVVLVGLALPSDNIHAPNEHFGVERLKLGTLLIVRALEILGK